MKRFLTLFSCMLGAVAIVWLTPVLARDRSAFMYSNAGTSQSLLEQKVESISGRSHDVYELWNNGSLVGVLSSKDALNRFLKQVYREQYAEQFPDSAVDLGKDVVLTKEQSYYTYENIDAQIFQYLQDNSLFTLKAVSVEFSDDNGIYAQIHVANEDLYQKAMQTYLSYFISEDELALLNAGSGTPELKTYGSRAVGVTIAQNITLSDDDYASPDEIMTSEDQVLEYLEYGSGTEKKYYTVEAYDTVAGVGSKNYGLSATQVMNINRDKISSVDQVLQAGEVLCVTYFNSPIDITVSQERMIREDIYPQVDYQEDNTLYEGQTEIKQKGVNGSRNALYGEKWINGVLVSGSLISSVDTLQPINEIIAVGTLEVPGVGTGEFRWPVDNPSVSCHWGCYYGHRAIDVVNTYNPYGNVYAADRGVIEENDYNPVSGNYVVINHNNGYHTFYGHMNVPSTLPVGTIVDKGQYIGQIGMTGRATGPHVHFFIVDDEKNRFDPCEGFLDCTVSVP